MNVPLFSNEVFEDVTEMQVKMESPKSGVIPNPTGLASLEEERKTRGQTHPEEEAAV